MGQAAIDEINSPAGLPVESPNPFADEWPVTDRWSIADRLIAIAIVLGGIVLRVRNYLHASSLWQDEASVSLNLRARTYGQLLKPLDYDQGAPVGFLLLVKAVISLLHVNELSLRLLPLLAGIAVLVFGYQIARRTGLAPLAGWVFVAMLAASQTLVVFSAQIKQYSLDSAVAIGLVLPAMAFARAGARPRAAIMWAVATAAAVWFSHPSVFVIGGTVLTVMIYCWRAGRTRDAIVAGAVGAAGAISFAISYVLFDRSLVGNAYLQAFWNEGYMPYDSARHAAGWIGKSLLAASYLPLGNRSFIFVIIGVLLGTIAMFRRQKYLLLGLFTGPAVIAFAAAVTHFYPFKWRLLEFLVPASLYLCAYGVDWIWTAATPRWRWAGAALAAASLAVSGYKSAKTLIRPLEQQQTQPVFAYIAKHRVAGERICVVNAANTPYLYYMPQYDLGPGTLIDAKTPEAAAAAVGKFHGRVWLYTVNLSNGMVYTEKPVFKEFESRGRRIDKIESTGVQAFEYEMP